jgi:predicted Na+-dependent transporter
MLFHQAQLFACAILARRYGARPQAAPGVESTLKPAAVRAA